MKKNLQIIFVLILLSANIIVADNTIGSIDILDAAMALELAGVREIIEQYRLQPKKELINALHEEVGLGIAAAVVIANDIEQLAINELEFDENTEIDVEKMAQYLERIAALQEQKYQALKVLDPELLPETAYMFLRLWLQEYEDIQQDLKDQLAAQKGQIVGDILETEQQDNEESATSEMVSGVEVSGTEGLIKEVDAVENQGENESFEDAVVNASEMKPIVQKGQEGDQRNSKYLRSRVNGVR